MNAQATSEKGLEQPSRYSGVLPGLAYVGAVLPKRSETFVYREVLGLRARGHAVVAVSLRRADDDEVCDDPTLRELRDEAVVVYEPGWKGRALRGLTRRPIGAVRSAIRLFVAACVSRDLGIKGWAKLPVQWLGGVSLAEALRRRGFEHVGHQLHAHMAHAPTTVAMVAADTLGMPFSFTGHAADLFRDRALLRGKLRRAAFVACISEWHRGWYRGVEPALTDTKLPVIRCGVDLEAFAPPIDVSDAAERGPRVLAVGRLVPKKGFDMLLRAWAGWLADHGHLPAGPAAGDGSENPPGIDPGQPASGSTGLDSGPICTIIGNGPEAEALAALAHRLQIGAFVEFTGAANQSQVRAAMRGCDVFALPCRPAEDGDRDGIPVVLMEAMACEKPVIGGDLSGIRELLTDNSGARRVDPGNVVMLQRALEDLLGNSEVRRDAGLRGRRRVAEEFSAAVNLDRLERAFAAASRGSDDAVSDDQGCGRNGASHNG